MHACMHACMHAYTIHEYVCMDAYIHAKTLTPGRRHRAPQPKTSRPLDTSHQTARARPPPVRIQCIHASVRVCVYIYTYTCARIHMRVLDNHRRVPIRVRKIPSAASLALPRPPTAKVDRHQRRALHVEAVLAPRTVGINRNSHSLGPARRVVRGRVRVEVRRELVAEVGQGRLHRPPN